MADSSHMDSLSRLRSATAHPRWLLAFLLVAGLVALTGAGALATRAISDRFADAALAKLGDDPQDILDQIASRVVDDLTKGAALDDAQQALVTELAGAAGKKLEDVDVTALLRTVEGQVVAAGLDKLNAISTQAIIDEVTKALVAAAAAEIDQIDLEALARGVLQDLAASVDLEGLVNEQLAGLDVEALIASAITQQLSGSGSGNLGGLFGLLLGR